MAPQLSGPAGSLTSVAYNEETAKTRYAQTVSGKASSLTLFAFGGDKWGNCGVKVTKIKTMKQNINK